MGFSRQEHWSGLPFPPPRDLPDPTILYCRQISYHWATRKATCPHANLYILSNSDTWYGKTFVFCRVLNMNKHSLQFSSVAQSCPTLCDPMNCSSPGSSVHGILQARTLEWVAIPFFGGSSQPRDQAWVSRIAGRVFTVWATREAFILLKNRSNYWFFSLNKLQKQGFNFR